MPKKDGEKLRSDASSSAPSVSALLSLKVDEGDKSQPIQGNEKKEEEEDKPADKSQEMEEKLKELKQEVSDLNFQYNVCDLLKIDAAELLKLPEGERMPYIKDQYYQYLLQSKRQLMELWEKRELY